MSGHAGIRAAVPQPSADGGLASTVAIGILPLVAARPSSEGRSTRSRSRRATRYGPSKEAGPPGVMPIWLGSGTRQETVVVREIQHIVPDEMHMHETVLAIGRFESDAKAYQSQSKYVIAAECLEQSSRLRQKFLGDNHQDFLSSLEQYVVLCNFWGIRCLNLGEHTSSLELLRKAEKATEVENVPNFKRRLSLRATAFNNLCCYFRHRGKLNAALHFAEKALKIEQRFKEAENPARSHLNYAFLLSMVSRNDEALEHIESAISILHDEERQISYDFSGKECSGDQQVQRYQEVVSVLVVAYFNMYVELGRLSRREAGVDFLLGAAILPSESSVDPTH